jgi:hypothetical protein
MSDQIISCTQWLPDGDTFIREQHLRPADMELVEKLFHEAASCAGPIGGYLEAIPEDADTKTVSLHGEKLHSRLLARHLSNQERIFPFVATCGQELSAWVDSKTDLMENYLAHALAEQATHLIAETLRREIESKYSLDNLSRMQPGSLPDWPLEQQGPLFRILGALPQKIHVQLTETFLMLPTNSLSGIFFQDPEGFISCQLCSRKCPRRKAPFDPQRLAELSSRNKDMETI